jgi:gas vesicle protein
MAMDRDKTGVLLTGILIGGFIGAVLALIYAPTSGKRLRRDIARKAEEFADDVEDIYHDGKEKAFEWIKEGKKKAASVVEDAKNIFKSST